jgi:hypothetical protein
MISDFTPIRSLDSSRSEPQILKDKNFLVHFFREANIFKKLRTCDKANRWVTNAVLPHGWGNQVKLSMDLRLVVRGCE